MWLCIRGVFVSQRKTVYGVCRCYKIDELPHLPADLDYGLEPRLVSTKNVKKKLCSLLSCREHIRAYGWRGGG